MMLWYKFVTFPNEVHDYDVSFFKTKHDSLTLNYALLDFKSLNPHRKGNKVVYNAVSNLYNKHLKSYLKSYYNTITTAGKNDTLKK